MAHQITSTEFKLLMGGISVATAAVGAALIKRELKSYKTRRNIIITDHTKSLLERAQDIDTNYGK